MNNVRGTEVTVPHLAESLVSATVAKWLRKPGDYIEQYDIICELVTEKVTVEMPCPIEGVLKTILVQEGETADVGAPMCIIEEPGQAAAAVVEPAGQPIAAAAGSGHEPVHTAPAALKNRNAASIPDEEGSLRHRYSPAVLRLAEEHGVGLEQVQGTGLGGRITRKDILQYVENGKPIRSQAPVAIPEPDRAPVRSTGMHLSENPPTPKIETVGQTVEGRGETFIDVTPIRSTIARNTRQSVTEIPHAWTMIEVDVTNLVVLRNKWKDEFIRKEGFNLTYLAFVLKAVVNAIKDYPIMNSVWAVDKIIVKKDINLSLLVGTEDSVLAPVIKKADQKTVAGLAQEIDDLTKRGRAGKLSLSEMTGGTFTVNNTGSFGSILSYPIINYPQAAIVTFESIVKKPVVIQDMIAVRSIANMCLSLDHRILDGVICGRFLQRVKENLESYNLETKLF
ncbi:dihydrolipoamide acetyltransferase family protein [Paenibacillus sp. MBLB4367]|uniref:dihydrolipoamide acetyltransferase family protein n=1 Tax=Paenibacillus sp. MBLB4367 TaxID=3384767 RepID=UPI0039082A01